MRFGALCALALILAAVAPRTANAQEIKLGYIDTIKIFGEFKETVDAEAVYKKEVDAWKKQASDMEAVLARMREELQSQSLMLSQEKLAEKKLAYEQKGREYEAFMKDVFGDGGKAERRNKELTQPIVEKINAVIADLAKEDGYTIIFDSAQGNIVFAAKTLDITDKVMERLEKQLAPASKSEPTKQ